VGETSSLTTGVEARHDAIGNVGVQNTEALTADPKTCVNLAWRMGVQTFPLTADPETCVDLRGAWVSKRFLGANVAGLDPPGEQIDGRLTRMEEPRTLPFGVKYNF